MKRCPECRRDYVDDSLLYCLEDGAVLVQGSVAEPDEPPTAILHETAQPNEAATRAQVHMTDQTAVLPVSNGDVVAKPRVADKRLLFVPLALAVIILSGIFGYRYVTQAKQIDSIAVMPFVNDSGNAENEYLSDGMTETLISSLSKIANLSVKARSAVFSYKGKDASPKKIGDDLGVQAVLLGRLVERTGNIRLNLELVNAKTLDVIWSEQYDRKQTDLVNLQNEIARDVSGKLRARLSGEDQQKLNKKYTDDPETYRLYLQARYCLNKRVGKEYEKAEGFLQQALQRDPNFALGYTGLAEFVMERDRPKSKDYVLKALAIDPDLSDAHALLGRHFFLDREWAASERELKRAIELDPLSRLAYHWNGTRLMMIGRFDEALAELDRAVAMDPLLPDTVGSRATCLVAAGRVDDGIAQLKQAIEIDPTHPWSYSQLSFVYRMKGDRDASVESRARAAELADRPELAARLRSTYRERGWNAYLLELVDQTKDQFPNEVRKASIFSELGRKEEALAALDRSAAKGEWWLFSIKYDPAFDPIRGDPRFQALLRQFEAPK